MAALKSFKSVGVLVYANTKSGDWEMIPSAAKQLSKTEEAGKYIPKLMVTSADGSQPIGVVSYEALKKDARKEARKMRKRIATFKESADSVDLESDRVFNKPLAPEQQWTNSEGKAIHASVLKIDGDTVEFLIKGKQLSYPLSKLSEESRGKLEALAQ